MRIGDWKILGSHDLTRFELYNLGDNNQEQTELSAKHPEKFTQLKQTLIEHDREVMAEGPDWWKNEIDRKP